MISSHATSTPHALDKHMMDYIPNSPNLFSTDNNDNIFPVSSSTSMNVNDTLHINNTSDINHTQSIRTIPNAPSDTTNNSPDTFNQNDGTLFLSDEYICNKNEPWGIIYLQNPSIL